MKIEPLQRHFERDFLEIWAEKTREYAIPVAQRLYCVGKTTALPVCGAFLGRRSEHSSAERCDTCQHHTCIDCKSSYLSNPLNHACSEPTQEADPLQGLERGTDYQKCPSCNIPVELMDGCNHITCRFCRTHFCFLCGAQAIPSDGHWTLGQPCPLYNRPGAANAQYAAVVHPAEAAQIQADENEFAQLLIAELDADDDTNIGTDDDAPQLGLRRVDRRWIDEQIRRLADERTAAFAAGQQPNVVNQAVIMLLLSLLTVIERYTLDLEQDEGIRALKLRSYSTAIDVLNIRLAAVPDDSFTQYPRIDAMLDTIRSAIFGADMAEVATARLAQL